jgi:hypothetical protein
LDKDSFKEHPFIGEDQIDRYKNEAKAYFFRRRHEELMKDKQSPYANLSSTERKKFLEAEYRPIQNQMESDFQSSRKAEAERQAKLEAEAAYQLRVEAERQAKIKAENEIYQATIEKQRILVREEQQRKEELYAKIDKLDRGIVNAPTRKERDELRRERGKLLGINPFFTYKNHCWNCKKPIHSDLHSRCPKCKLYICAYCSVCMCTFPARE